MFNISYYIPNATMIFSIILHIYDFISKLTHSSPLCTGHFDLWRSYHFDSRSVRLWPLRVQFFDEFRFCIDHVGACHVAACRLIFWNLSCWRFSFGACYLSACYMGASYFDMCHFYICRFANYRFIICDFGVCKFAAIVLVVVIWHLAYFC